MSHDEIYEYLNKHSLGIVSTIDVNINGQPESAVIGFGQTHELELIFRTDKRSRKYHNLYSNPRIAFVIGWDHGQTLQYEGIAHELLADEMAVVEKNYFNKHGVKEHYKPEPDNTDLRYFLVKPSWIRFTDVKSDPWKVSELTF